MLSIIIFGGTGDLARKKLFKSLYSLYAKQLLPQNTTIIGFARRDLNTESYRQFVSEALEDDLELKEEFLERFYYFQGNLSQEQSYHDLRTYLMTIDEQFKVCSKKLFYVSVRPELYGDVFDLLQKTNVLHTCGDSSQEFWSRLLIEKPFGTNSEHAKELDKKLATLTSENQIFRIDHYLAKEALENILVFRFKNKIFNAVWTKEFISKIHIRLFETRGVGERGEFYDQVGALRDVGQNHALQMLALVTMGQPDSFTGLEIRQKRSEILSKIIPAPIDPDTFERKQYNAYQEEIGHSSETETYFKIALHIQDEKWDSVPCIIESGKSMQKNETSIQVDFVDGNTVYFEIQPTPRIALSFNVKNSGYDYKTSITEFEYQDVQKNRFALEAYEKILYQAIVGDVTSFVSTEEVLSQWRIIDTILSTWSEIPLQKHD